MDAITLLENDHEEIRKLLKKLEPEIGPTTEHPNTRRELFEKLRRELTVHEVIEEEIFYPTLKQHPKAKEEVLEGYEEHHVVDSIVGDLEATPYDDETWGAKADVMSENLQHHMEEEESDMFPKARKVLDERELEDLGTAMAERKAEALKQESAGQLR